MSERRIDMIKAMNGDLRQVVILVSLVMAGSLGGGFVHRTIDPPRPDPFLGADATALEGRIVQRIEAMEARLRLELVQLELKIRHDMPPEPTRRRLRAIERQLTRMDPDFEPPTSQFNDATGGHF